MVVVGAGPAGSTCARICAEEGLATCLIEEHAAAGYPVQCAGLLSLDAFSECEVSRKAVLHEVSGARIVSGKGSSVSFGTGRTRAYVVDRGVLDHEMVRNAAQAGADIRLKTAFCGRSGNRIQVRGQDGRQEIAFRVLIAADGPRSSIARDLGMARARVFLAGLQAEIPWEMDGSRVGIYPDASPDFFGWIIPSGRGRARIGLAGQQDAGRRFADFLSVMGAGGSRIHLVTGTIPLGVMPRTYGSRTLFVGDAAGFAKPTSGGGVYTGIRSARHAARTAIEACRLDDASDRVLSGYEKLWKDDIGKELAYGFRLFRMRQRMTKDDMDRVVRALNDPGIVREIEEFGDMDRPGTIARRLLANPRIYPIIGILFGKAVASFFK